MNGKKTIVILIIAFLLGGYIYFFERKEPGTAERIKQENKVFHLKSQDVEQLQIRKGKQILLLKRKENSSPWQIKKPLEAKADKSRVDNILLRLESFRFARRLQAEKGQPLNRKDFGLAKPRMEVTLWVKKKPRTLTIGDETPGKRNVYVRFKGDKDILIVAKNIYAVLDQKVTDLRDRTVIEVDKNKVDKLKIQYPDRSLECVKKDDKWQIIRPISAKADKEEIGGLLEKLTRLRVENFVSEDSSHLKKYGLETPRLIVTIGQEGKERTLIFGNAVKEKARIYAKRKSLNSIYSLEKGILKDFTLKANDLRDKQVLSFSLYQVKKITLEKAGTTFLARREAGKWKLVQPRGWKAKQDVIANILWKLSDLRAQKIVAEEPVALKKYGLDKPFIKVILGFGKKEKKETLLIGKNATGKRFYALKEGGQTIFELHPSTIDSLKDLGEVKQ